MAVCFTVLRTSQPPPPSPPTPPPPRCRYLAALASTHARVVGDASSRTVDVLIESGVETIRRAPEALLRTLFDCSGGNVERQEQCAGAQKLLDDVTTFRNNKNKDLADAALADARIILVKIAYAEYDEAFSVGSLTEQLIVKPLDGVLVHISDPTKDAVVKEAVVINKDYAQPLETTLRQKMSNFLGSIAFSALAHAKDSAKAEFADTFPNFYALVSAVDSA